jgi:hypothetical protein
MLGLSSVDWRSLEPRMISIFSAPALAVHLKA